MQQFKIGDFVRRGGDWGIYRVVDVWPSRRADRDYIFSAVLCSEHKFHKRGTLKKLEWASEYQVDSDPQAIARYGGFPFVADTPTPPDFRPIYGAVLATKEMQDG